MEISAKTRKLKNILEDESLCIRRYGEEMTKKISLRLAELQAAESLSAFWPPNSGPERCHELKGNLKGTYSMDLKHPFRLLFIADHDRLPPETTDPKEKWANITAIQVTGIEDTHG